MFAFRFENDSETQLFYPISFSKAIQGGGARMLSCCATFAAQFASSVNRRTLKTCFEKLSSSFTEAKNVCVL